MIYHWTYYIYLAYISSFFCSWFILLNLFSFIIIFLWVSCFSLFLRIHFFISWIHFLVSAWYFDFWIFYIIFTITLIVSLVAWTFDLFSFWGYQWNSKWFFFIFLINVLVFRNFIAASKSIFSFKIWFIFLFIILLIKALILLLLYMINKICLSLRILKWRELLSWNIASRKNSIHMNSKIVFLKMMIMKVVIFLLLKTMQIILLKFIFLFSWFFFKEMGLNNALISRSGLWRTLFLFIVKIIFSILFIARGLNILHVARCLLKSRMSVFLSSWAPDLVLISMFLTWLCTLYAIMLSFNSRSAVIAEDFWFLQWCRTDGRLLHHLIFFVHFLSQSECFIHSATNIHYWRTY